MTEKESIPKFYELYLDQTIGYQGVRRTRKVCRAQHSAITRSRTPCFHKRIRSLTLRQQAVQGDVEAQYRLGIMSHTGEGVPQNEAEAVQWLQRAATQGHPEAQRLLGRLYLAGQGVPRNETAAAYWYRQAADQGDPEAQWQLGRLALAGQGLPRNEAEAVSWYRRAAAQGDPEMQWQLGLKYLQQFPEVDKSQ